MGDPLAILPVCGLLLGALCFLLQFVALPSDEWGYFRTRRIRGLREERGHFGLWRLCSTKGDDPEEICVHPRDETYDLPTYSTAAGVVSILHLLLVACFVALAFVRVLQIWKRAPDLYLGTKRLCVVKVGVAVVCSVLSISVSILASVGEGIFRKFIVYKGWAFWVQVAIISVDTVLLLVCAFENIQWWQAGWVEPAPRDPSDAHPETFRAPDYDHAPRLHPEPLERVVYVRDAGVQSRLDDNNFLQVPDSMFRTKKLRDDGVTFQEPNDFYRRGDAIGEVRGRDSPHPKKKAAAYPTRII